MKNDYRLMASMALFRELHNQEHDLYQILAVFVRQLIWDKRMYTFSAGELTRRLNLEYGFDLKEAVVKVALKRLNINCKSGVFRVDNVSELAFEENETINETLEIYDKENEKILKELIRFVEAYDNELDIQQLQKDFIEFVTTNGTNSRYAEYISAFVIEYSKWPEKMKVIERIKEGNLLYEGIRMNDNSELNELGIWKEAMNIYLEMDVLFYLGGFSGSLYHNMIRDVLDYVKEINETFRVKNSKNRIRLYYFPEVKEEIETFFEQAEKILRRKELVDPSVPAMQKILENCKTASDVVEKQSRFFSELQARGIVEYSSDRKFYRKEDYSENIESLKFIKENLAGEDEEKISRWLQRINYIGFLRQGHIINSFEQAVCVTLTNNNGIMRLERNLQLEEKVHRVTSMDYIINKFWFQLNKGFGQGKLPKSMEVLTKAQLVLSTQLTKTVTEQFDKIRTEYDKGNMSHDDMVASIMMLRRKMRYPEDIIPDSTEETIRDIKETDIEKMTQEYHFAIVHAKEEEQKREDGEKELQKVQQAYENEQKGRVLAEFECERVQEELAVAREQNRLYEEKEKEREIKQKKVRYISKKIVSGIFTVGLAVGAFVLWKHDKEFASYVLGILTLISTVASWFVGKKDKDNYKQ